MAKTTQELTPMQRQYQQIKERNQDCILFFRLAISMKCSMKMPGWLPGSWI